VLKYSPSSEIVLLITIMATNLYLCMNPYHPYRRKCEPVARQVGLPRLKNPLIVSAATGIALVINPLIGIVATLLAIFALIYPIVRVVVSQSFKRKNGKAKILALVVVIPIIGAGIFPHTVYAATSFSYNYTGTCDLYWSSSTIGSTGGGALTTGSGGSAPGSNTSIGQTWNALGTLAVVQSCSVACNPTGTASVAPFRWPMSHPIYRTI